MRFMLAITLGNDAMQTGEDVADALRAVAAQLEQHGTITEDDAVQVGIRDLNGNSVGTWKVER